MCDVFLLTASWKMFPPTWIYEQSHIIILHSDPHWILQEYLKRFWKNFTCKKVMIVFEHLPVTFVTSYETEGLNYLLPVEYCSNAQLIAIEQLHLNSIDCDWPLRSISVQLILFMFFLCHVSIFFVKIWCLDFKHFWCDVLFNWKITKLILFRFKRNVFKSMIWCVKFWNTWKILNCTIDDGSKTDF